MWDNKEHERNDYNESINKWRTTRINNDVSKCSKRFWGFPFIQTTEDLFRWREKVKEENGNDGNRRNEIIEAAIKGNASLEKLYAWSKFTRMVDRAKADVFMAKVEYHIEDNNAYRIKAAGMMEDYLKKEKKARPDHLSGIFKIPELSLGIRYKLRRSFNSTYEYAKSLVKEDEQEAWPAVLFVALMNAYGIDNEALLTVGRQAEELSKRYCKEIESVATSKNEIQLEKPLVYRKK